MKKPRATPFAGSAARAQPLCLGGSVAADEAGGAAEGIGFVMATEGAAGAVANGAGASSTEGAGLAADGGGRGTDADTQRKCALNLKCKWSSFSSTHVPGSSFCSIPTMTKFWQASRAFLLRHSETPSPPGGVRSAWATGTYDKRFSVDRARTAARRIMMDTICITHSGIRGEVPSKKTPV